LNIPSGLRSIIGTGHSRGWMMLAGAPEHSEYEELDARRVQLDLRARCEPAVSHAAATAGDGHQPELLDWIDRTTTHPAPSAHSHDINLARAARWTPPPVSSPRQRRGPQPALLVVALSIGSASVGIPAGYFLPRPNTASSRLPTQTTSASAGIPNAIK